MTNQQKGRQLSLAEKVDPVHTALVVVDMQNDFCHPDGYHGYNGDDLSMMPGAIANMRRLVLTARQAGTLIVWVRATYDEVVLGEPLAEVLSKGGTSPVRCAEGSWGADFLDELRPLDAPNEIVLTKHRFSAFWDTEIDLTLRSNGIKSVVVAGVITSGCVESTARDAYFRNYYVVLPGDASGSYSRERHDAALRKLALTFGVVTQTDDVARLWSHAAAGPRGWQLDAKRAQVLHTLEQLTDPAHAALVIVDMQNDFCHPDGLMGKRGEDLSHNRTIIATIARLLDSARKAGVMVVHVQAQYGNGSGTPSWLFSADDSKTTLHICLPGSWGAQQVDELAPKDGEPIVVKHRYSAFIDTALELLLRSNGIRSLVVTGTATQACVESTVRDAKMLDYYVTVPRDGVGARARHRHMHDASLEAMGTYFATITDADAVTALWDGSNARSARAAE